MFGWHTFLESFKKMTKELHTSNSKRLLCKILFFDFSQSIVALDLMQPPKKSFTNLKLDSNDTSLKRLVVLVFIEVAFGIIELACVAPNKITVDFSWCHICGFKLIMHRVGNELISELIPSFIEILKLTNTFNACTY